MATQTIDRVVHTTTIKRRGAYSTKTQENNNSTSNKPATNKLKHTRKVRRGKKNASK